jgi:hypothetical protein
VRRRQSTPAVTVHQLQHGGRLVFDQRPGHDSDWSAPSSSQRWSIPLGGGAGKIFKIDGQSMNAQSQALGYVARPSGGPNWALRFQVQFFFFPRCYSGSKRRRSLQLG